MPIGFLVEPNIDTRLVYDATGNEHVQRGETISFHCISAKIVLDDGVEAGIRVAATRSCQPPTSLWRLLACSTFTESVRSQTLTNTWQRRQRSEVEC